MEIIFISGPSGSGKTVLSNQILLKKKDGFVLSTDNYYKTGLISKILSKILQGYYDRSISFDYRLFKKDFDFIVKNKISMYERSYNFKNKTTNKILKEKINIKYLIVEGIFSKEFLNTLFNKNYFFIEIQIKKNDCMNRVIKRDSTERGKSRKQAENDFINSWDLYYKKSKNEHNKKNSNYYNVTKNTDIDHLLKKIFNLNS